MLKSVAHSFGHSFTSSLNYRDDNYVIVHLLRRAREAGGGTLVVDILSGESTPEALAPAPAQDSIRSYRNGFSRLVESHQTSLDRVRSARMSLTFDFSISRPNDFYPQYREYPYVCRVEIEDDRGKAWVAEIRDWMYPEAGDLTSCAVFVPSDMVETDAKPEGGGSSAVLLARIGAAIRNGLGWFVSRFDRTVRR